MSAAVVGVSLSAAAQYDSSAASLATSNGIAANDEASMCSARTNGVGEEFATSGNEGYSDLDASHVTTTSGTLLQRAMSKNAWCHEDDDNKQSMNTVGERPPMITPEHAAADPKCLSSSLSSSRSQSQYHSIQQLSRPSINGYDTPLGVLQSSERLVQEERAPRLVERGNRTVSRVEREEYHRNDVLQLDIDNNNGRIDEEMAFHRRRMNGLRSIHSDEARSSDHMSTPPSVHYPQTIKDSRRTDVGPRAEQILHRKRMLSPTQQVAMDDMDEPTMMTSPSELRGTIQTSWSSSSSLVASEYNGAAEAKRARVENIINSMQAISTPSPPETATVDMYTSGPAAQRSDSSRHIDEVEGSADIVTDGPEGNSSTVPSSGVVLETSDTLGQRRSSRRKQYVPQHQHMNNHTENFRSFIERLDEHGHTTRQLDDYGRTDEDDNEQDGHISEEEAKQIQTAAVREGLRRVEQRLATMRQTFLGLSRDDDVIIDVESDDAAEVCNDKVASDFSRNEIRRLVAGTWFRSSVEKVSDEVRSDDNKVHKKKEHLEARIDDKVVRNSNNNNNNNNKNNNQLAKLAAMLKAEISDSVGSLVDDIVSTFVERYFDRRAANRKSAISQEREQDHLGSGSNHKTRNDGYSVSRYDSVQRHNTPRSPGTFSDDVSSGYIDEQTADDEDHITKLVEAESEERSKSPGGTIHSSLPSVPQSDGSLPFPFPVSVGDEEAMRQSAARLVAYRQALAAAYLDSAFTQPNKTAFEVPRNSGHHQQVALPATVTPSHRLFTPHPYYPSTGTRFEAHHTTMPFVKEPEQTEAIPLVVNTPKKKRTKVTDTRLSPRAARALLHESLQQQMAEPRLDHHHQQLPHQYSPHHLHYESQQQSQHYQQQQQQQQQHYDSSNNNLEMRVRSVSPTDDGQQQQLYDRRLHAHHHRHIRHHQHQQQLLQKQIDEDQEQHRQYDRQPSASSVSLSGSRPEVDTSGPTSSLHEAFHHRTATSHHHQHHHRYFSPATASHHQPLSSGPTPVIPALIDINQSAAAGLSLPTPLAPIPPSSSALEQHIQAIYVAAAVAAAAHSASRGGPSHTSSSLIGSANSTSGPCRDVHQHHVRSSSLVVGAGHHSQLQQQQQPPGSVFGEQTNRGVRPEVVELNACLVGGRTACGGRMLMKQDSSSASYDQLLMQGANYESLAVTSTLTPMHLRKAKLMFFYVRYPSSSVLKEYFPDVRFNKNNTAQLVKWFSNFREFFYIQMEKYARQAIADGVKVANELIVSTDAEIYRVLILHYNRNNQIEVPESFRYAIQAALREFFMSIVAEKDQEQSWKKAIYKVIARLDEPVPEYFKSANWLEQLADC